MSFLMLHSMWACLIIGADVQPNPWLKTSTAGTLKSASGSIELRMQPIATNGEKTSVQYFLKKDTKLVWQKKLDFAMQNGVVTNDGHVVGLAYGIPCEGAPEEDCVSFVSIRVDGTTNVHELAFRYQPSDDFHVPIGPQPVGRRLAVNEIEHCAMVWLAGVSCISGDTIWVFDYTVGKLLGKIVADSVLKRSEGDYVAVSDTQFIVGEPMLLIHALQNASDSIFALTELSGELIWSHYIPDDYRGVFPPGREHLNYKYVENNPAILSTSKAKSFDIFLVSQREQVSFEIGRAAEKWTIVERKRVPRWAAPATMERVP